MAFYKPKLCPLFHLVIAVSLKSKFKCYTRIMEFKGISFGLSTHTLIFWPKITLKIQVFLYIRLRTQLKDTSPSSRLIYFELFCNQLVLFPTARTTKRRNLMLVVGNKISVLGGYILPVKSCGFFQGILKAKVL